MTREEAIEQLQWLLEYGYVDEFEDEYDNALKIAIKVLSVIEDMKQEIKDLHNSHMIHFVSADDAVDTCLEIIAKHIGRSRNE